MCVRLMEHAKSIHEQIRDLLIEKGIQCLPPSKISMSSPHYGGFFQLIGSYLEHCLRKRWAPSHFRPFRSPQEVYCTWKTEVVGSWDLHSSATIAPDF